METSVIPRCCIPSTVVLVFNLIVSQRDKAMVMEHIQRYYDCYEIGTIERGNEKVVFEKKISWL